MFVPADPPRFGQLHGKPLLEALPDVLNDDGYWTVAAATALALVARGRIVPGVTAGGHDTWRVGPLDHADELHLRQLAAHGDYDELRGFLDAVADTLPRTGEGPFAGTEPHDVSELKAWADEQIKLSLRIETTDDLRFRAIVQVRAITDPYPQDVRGSGRELDAIRAMARVNWPPLQRLLDQAELTDGEVAELLGTDIEVHWPRDIATTLSAKAVIGEAGGRFQAGDLLTFDWRLALGGEELTEAEMDVIAEASRPIVKLRDQWVLIDPKLKKKVRQQLKPLTAVQAVTAALTGVAIIDGEHVEVAPHSLTTAITTIPQFLQPAALRARLRDYQLHGLRWLAHMTGLGLGACLADDMGLGKTITLIALHLHRADERPTLVVCPASLLGNWEREIHRFAPGVSVSRYHGPQRTLATRGVVLTTYGTMRLDAEALRGHEWGMVVADEAQHVKNPHSGTAKALRSIPAAARVALSGTPVENSLSELWAVLDWTTPGLLGTHRAFRTRWPEPDDTLAKVVRPFLLRRRKSDPGVAPELPAKTETDRYVSLGVEQAALYEALTRETLDQIAGSDGMARRGLVLKLLTGLKQICNHPSHYLGHPTLQGTSGKLDLLDELLDTIVAEDGSALIFTQYVAMARLLEQHIKQPTRFLHGGTPVPQREQMVDDFQNGRAPVFLLSLKAAGTGLNLTRADHVIHFDRWWNPAVEDQATDRAYRIGQTRPVQVHKLVTEGTVEERIAALLQDKRDLADAVLHGGEAGFTELTDAELAELVQLRSAQ
ncbi:Superfamily II DNA or RNA helicase, SNF2 family [Lentzea waywayandensis]|uniref:Superfamily II DNA or RNA helicase, SNF2 family n=1 Tax=Lentzea waywayandensis TaxID=84724 RepID=A0A1I6FC20_9PSEU|nr:DEAD/DEAH box helicase [Lentzea waywayandensis]SFR27494.1 Superfamily II DNA or RNA helicase, SNF2 family [Lentzea waywayandensis]